MKISLILPAYNVAQYVGVCLDSILAQTHKNFEALIMDDGSKDKTLQILKDYARKDKRIKVFSHKNAGVTSSRNELLDKVSKDTDAIFYLDTDDMIHPKTLETLAYYMKKYKADVVECCLTRVEHNTILPEYKEVKYPRKDIKILDDMNIFWSNKTRIGPWINIWNKLYKWDKVKYLRFSNKLAYEEDYFYGCLVHDTISRKVLIPDVLYYYRKNPTSVNGKLNFERYVRTTANRIQLSYDTFLKTGKVPEKYRSDFEYDLVNDCYRMVIRKNLKKNKNFKSCKKMFLLSAQYINYFYNNKIVDFKRLNIIKRWMVFLTRHHQFILAKMLVQLT